MNFVKILSLSYDSPDYQLAYCLYQQSATEYFVYFELIQ